MRALPPVPISKLGNPVVVDRWFQRVAAPELKFSSTAPRIWVRFVGRTLLILGSARAGAGNFSWKNPPVSGAFNAASSWRNDDGGGGYPGLGDFALFRAGTYTVTCAGSASGLTSVVGTVTFQLAGDYSVGEWVQGGNPITLQGGGTLRGGPFSIPDGSIVVDGSGLTLNGFNFGIAGITTRVTGKNGARITSSGPASPLPRPRLEGGSEWHHTGSLNAGNCTIVGGSILAADELRVAPAELDAGRLQAGHLIGGGHAKNGSAITADTASLSDWLLEGAGTGVYLTGTTVPGLLYADISIKSGATFNAGALADNAWYTVDGSGSTLAVAGNITPDGPQKVTVLNQGQGSAGSLTRAYVTVRGPGSLFTFDTVATDSTLIVQNGAQMRGGRVHGSTNPGTTTGVSLNGADASLTLSGNLELGTFGPGALDVSDGGRVECATGVLDGGQPGGQNNSSIFGVDSFWVARLGLVVGDREGLVTLNLGSGGRVQVRGSGLAVGGVRGGAASEGRIVVDGSSAPSPSALDCRQTVLTGIGVNGKGLLNVRSRGRVLASKLTLGVNAGGDGTLEVIGAGTSLEVDETLKVGEDGVGRATISVGGLATAPEVLVGSTAGTSTLRLTGAGSLLTVADRLRLGRAGNGQLTVQQGARVVLNGVFTDPNPTDVGLCEVGADSGAGTIVVDGAGSVLRGLDAFLDLGLHGKGTLNVTAGGLVEFAAISIAGGQNQSSTATITGAGSVVRARDSFDIGSPFPGPGLDDVTVSNGGVLLSKSVLGVAKSGILRLSGGAGVVGQPNEAAIPGTLLVANFGKFYLGGRLIGSVVVRPGGIFLPGFSPGRATVEGDVTLATGTALEMELGGKVAGGSHDQIDATGVVTLAGRLDLVFRDGFAPTNAQVFELVRGGTVRGSFSEVTLRGLAPGFTYSLANVGGNSLRLTATSTGVPTTGPKLSITRPSAGEILVSWPDDVSGWVLQQSGSLPATTWQSLAAPGNRLTIPAAAGGKFYRLVLP